jgi:hypothetical protein
VGRDRNDSAGRRRGSVGVAEVGEIMCSIRSGRYRVSSRHAPAQHESPRRME